MKVIEFLIFSPGKVSSKVASQSTKKNKKKAAEQTTDKTKTLKMARDTLTNDR